ncbi:hypothetical protein ML462_08470 [Gramella lutea]|uniref:Leucine Rich repeats (2 copies) n=1 Tax=Christiangramia lutea TaxID=1607951 RepID=A0A9X1V2I5_9FLAO|nr:hypothetical protein [Christiangramia lutea]MCH4823207.1 hypothetical protein [Christiangramia lutea]
MSFSKKEKRFWKTKFSFGSKSNIPTEIEHFNLRDESFTNEELCFITSRIRRIERLDLDNNLIDDDGMPCLQNLEFIRELRLKSMNISDRAIDHLLYLKSLELLHLGSTEVTCGGVKRLSDLPNLKTLIVSPPEIDESSLDHFLKKRPDCELIVNYKPYKSSKP